jgi:hypothetical protein
VTFDFKNASPADLQAKYSEIAREIGDDQFFTKRELKHLPAVLADGEQVLAFSSGFMDGNTWLIALADKRILFLDKGMIYGLKQVAIDLDKVNAISCKTGLIFGSIRIEDSAKERQIQNVLKKTVVNFTNKVRDSIDARKRPQAPSIEATDIVSQIERLAALHEKGVLTRAEFDAQKTKLLNC